MDKSLLPLSFIEACLFWNSALFIAHLCWQDFFPLITLYWCWFLFFSVLHVVLLTLIILILAEHVFYIFLHLSKICKYIYMMMCKTEWFLYSLKRKMAVSPWNFTTKHTVRHHIEKIIPTTKQAINEKRTLEPWQDIFQGCFTLSLKKVDLTFGFTAYKTNKWLVKR